MSTFNPGGRRSFDGPMRRPAALPQQPAPQPPVVSAAPVVPPPVQPTVEEPVFEYRKSRRVRQGGGRGRKIVRGIAISLVAVVVLGGGWLGFKAVMAAHNIITSSGGGAPALAGLIDPTKLKGEGDGRINILVLGVGGDGHDGGNLTDTIMVLSLDPKTKDVAMLSVPRDLYVKIPAAGKYATQYGKINAANAYGGAELSEKVVETVIGVPIHYYALVDFSGFKQAIDAVGGIDINVKSALYDPAFPCDNDKGYCPLTVKAGQQHMNGAQALRYARCRHATCGGDFGRAARQQEVIVALRQKALQASTLTNPLKLSGLIDTLGSHVKTDIQLGEIKKLASIAKDVDTTKITNKVLDFGNPDSLLIDGSGTIAGAGSIELPKAGTFEYDDIHDYVKNIFTDHYLTDENARLEIQNGSGVSGMAATVAKSLKAAHYNVIDPTNADHTYAKTVIYDYTGGKKPYTINYLQQRFGVKATRVTMPSPTTDPATGQAAPVPEIRIILGSDYKPVTTPLAQ